MANVGDAAQSQGDIMRRLGELEGLVRELVAGRRLENATVGAGGLRVRGTGGITLQEGGGLTVEDGGDIIIRGDGVLYMEDAEGQQIVYIGADANGKQVFQLRRDNGEPILATQGSEKWGRDFWSLWDSNGNILISDDAETGIGLARPWLPVVLYRLFDSNTAEGGWGVSYIDVAEVTSPKVLWEGRASIQHPWITIDGQWGQITDGGDGALNNSHYELKIDGTTVGSWDETSLVTAQRGRFDVSDFVISDWAIVTLEVSASGDGAIACQVFGCYLF